MDGAEVLVGNALHSDRSVGGWPAMRWHFAHIPPTFVRHWPYRDRIESWTLVRFADGRLFNSKDQFLKRLPQELLVVYPR